MRLAFRAEASPSVGEWEMLAAGVKDNGVVFKDARQFAHAASGPLPGQPGRIPGCPFPVGLTYLVVGNGRSREICYGPSSKRPTSLAEIRHSLGRPEVSMLIEINAIFERVVRGLGHDPRVVMDMVRHDLQLMEKSGFIERGAGD